MFSHLFLYCNAVNCIVGQSDVVRNKKKCEFLHILAKFIFLILLFHIVSPKIVLSFVPRIVFVSSYIVLTLGFFV